MSIHVKYFGSTEFPPFEKMVNNMEEIKKLPFNKTAIRDSQIDVGVTKRHNSLADLGWEMSGHIGRPGALAGFDRGGRPTYLNLPGWDGGAGTDGTDGTDGVPGIPGAGLPAYPDVMSVLLYDPDVGYPEWVRVRRFGCVVPEQS